MIKVYADWNNRAENDDLWILWYRERELAEQVPELGLREGDRVILYQDGDDFEVEGSLHFRYVAALGHDTWVARPDYSTLSETGGR